MCLQIQDTKNVHFFLGEVFHRYKNMNSSFVVISKLVKSNIGEKFLVNCLMNLSAQALTDYLECANIYLRKKLILLK